MARQKHFVHKIYDANGVYITTLARDLVANVPKFTWAMNGGFGEMEIVLNLRLKDFTDSYEDSIIKFGHRVVTVISDGEGSNLRVYHGIITRYDPSMDERGINRVAVHVVGMTKELADNLVRSGTATTVAYASQDPSVMAKNLLTLYGGTIHYTGGTIEDTAQSLSYTFSFLSYLEALQIVLSLCPSFWYWYVDANDVFYLREPDFETINHTLHLGKQVSAIEASKSIEETYNVVYFKGGGDPPLYKSDSRTSSIDAYGRREYKMQDERVTVAGTATQMMTKFLDEHDHPRSLLTATVLDNSIDPARGYDIESIKPGDIMQIINPRTEIGYSLWDIAEFDVDFFDFNIIFSLSLPMQVIEVDYQFDQAVVKLSLTPSSL